MQMFLGTQIIFVKAGEYLRGWFEGWIPFLWTYNNLEILAIVSGYFLEIRRWK